jgi:hypothetical protein
VLLLQLPAQLMLPLLTFHGPQLLQHLPLLPSAATMLSLQCALVAQQVAQK